MSEVSVLSPSSSDRKHKTDKLTLLAVNDTPISTYGKRSLTFNLGLRRFLPWIFIIADVQKAILGADFLRHYELLVDVNRKQLVDTKLNCTFKEFCQLTHHRRRVFFRRAVIVSIRNCWHNFLRYHK